MRPRPARRLLLLRSAFVLALLAPVAGSAAAYRLQEVNTRGALSNGGTSLGAYTLTTTLYAFQGVNTTTDLSLYESALEQNDPIQTYVYSPEPLPSSSIWLADGLVDWSAPVNTVISGEYTEGTPVHFVSVSYFGPDPDTLGPWPKEHLIGNESYLTYSFTVVSETSIRYNFAITGRSPIDDRVYSYTASGALTRGLNGAPDGNTMSFVLREQKENGLIISARTTGTASSIPEPSTLGSALGLAALVHCLRRRRRA